VEVPPLSEVDDFSGFGVLDPSASRTLQLFFENLLSPGWAGVGHMMTLM
jgi:hypothetical protein